MIWKANAYYTTRTPITTRDTNIYNLHTVRGFMLGPVRITIYINV